MITDNDKPSNWKVHDIIREWHYEGFSLVGAITYEKPKDEFEIPYHAEVINPVDGERENSGAFYSFEAARLWVESEDFAAHSRYLSDESLLCDVVERDEQGVL